MPTSNNRRPFQEICECVQYELVREGAPGESAKYQGIVNQVYSNDLAALLPELYIRKEAFITLIAAYSAGTVTVGSATSTIDGTSTSWTSANSNNRMISVTGGTANYRMTYVSGTQLTFQDGLTWVGSSGTGATYTLFSDRYQLPSDFSHMIQDDTENPHVVYNNVGNSRLYLKLLTEEEYNNQIVSSVGIPYAYCIKWIKEVPYMYISLAAQSVGLLGYSYVPQLNTLSNYSSGTCTFAASTSVIATTAASWLLNVTTGTSTYYIRNDADGTGSASKWALISSVSNATALTLASTWAFTTGSGQTYTISEVSKWPARFDDAILYKAALIVDPDGVNNKKWEAIYTEAIGLDRGQESRRQSVRTFKSFPGTRR